MFNTLWWLIAGHFFADYVFQNNFLARGKNHLKPLPGIPWFWCLVAHGVIHGSMVLLVTSSLRLAFYETILHLVIDYHKSKGDIDFNQDQWLHIGCKILWFVLNFWNI